MDFEINTEVDIYIISDEINQLIAEEEDTASVFYGPYGLVACKHAPKNTIGFLGVIAISELTDREEYREEA